MCLNNNQTCELTLLTTKQGSVNNIIGIRTEAINVHAASGLNWGYNAGTASLGDAYIPVNMDDILVARHMFIKPSPVNIPINVVWDDNTEMTLLLEGNGVDLGDGNFYPKQISTYGNKSELGTYLRRRIGSRIGINLEYSTYAISTLATIKSNYAKNKQAIVSEIRNNPTLFQELNDKFITIDHLEEYGRTTISVSLQGGIYYFDFGVR